MFDTERAQAACALEYLPAPPCFSLSTISFFGLFPGTRRPFIYLFTRPDVYNARWIPCNPAQCLRKPLSVPESDTEILFHLHPRRDGCPLSRFAEGAISKWREIELDSVSTRQFCLPLLTVGTHVRRADFALWIRNKDSVYCALHCSSVDRLCIRSVHGFFRDIFYRRNNSSLHIGRISNIFFLDKIQTRRRLRLALFHGSWKRVYLPMRGFFRCGDEEANHATGG